MNKSLKFGLGMLVLEFGMTLLVGIAIAFLSISWTKEIILIGLFVIYNLLAIILLLAGLFKSQGINA
jgi:hypothetical protein